MYRFARVLGVALSWAALTGTAFAQSGIAGAVKDTSGAFLPGVTVEASSPALIEQVRSVVTGQSGQYNIVDLRPGVYTVTFTLPGFATTRHQGIELPATFTATVNAELRVGALEETVVVTGSAPVVDVRAAVQQSVMNREVLDTIPTGRNIFAQAALVAGVTTNRPDVGGSEGMQSINVQVHGSDGDDLAYQVDGMSVNSINNGGGTSGLYFNDAMIDEVSFQTSAMPAEVGSGGIRINMIPKDGGNEFNGTLFASGSEQRLQASNLTDELAGKGMRAVNGVDSIYDVNFSLGGPIRNDKLWFFGAIRRWSSNNLVANTFNLDGSQAIDDNRLTSVVGRLTWQASRRNKFAFYYDDQSKYRGHRRPGGTDFITPEATWVQKTPIGYTTQGKYTSTVSNTVLVEGGISVYYIDWTQEYRPESTALSAVDFVTSVRSGAASQDFEQINARRSYVGAVSYVTGSHAFKAGIQFSEGPFEETRDIRGDLVLRFANGAPNSVDTYNSPVRVKQRLNADMGVYAQDSWTMKRLTINPGIRLDYYNGSVEEQSAPAGRFIGERTFPAIRNAPNWTNIVPRFAVVYDVFGTGKTAIKASASQYVKNEGMALTTLGNLMGLSSSRRSWTDRNGDRQAQDDELGPGTGFSGGSNSRIDPDLTRPYNWEYTASIQHELAPRLAVSAAYFHRDYRNLYGVKNTLVTPSDYTPAVITNPLTNAPLTVYNQIAATQGQVDLLLANYDELSRTYDGVELKVDKRFGNGANLFGGVTFGRNEGSIRSTEDDLNNPNLLINHIGAVGFDAPYQSKIAGHYPLPWDVDVSGAVQITSGLPLQRIYTVTRAVVPGLTQVTQAVDLLPAGEERLPSRALIDVRLGKTFAFGSSRVQLMADIYNLLNSNATIGEVAAVGPRLGAPSEVVQGRLLRLGLQWHF
jgi:hypothetical protein